MSINKKDEEDDDRGSDSGGQGSGVEYHDWIRGEISEPLVSPDEKQRIKIGEHRGLHEINVKKQKDSLDNLEKLRKGDITLAAHRGLGMGGGAGGGDSPFKKHILGDTVQFGTGMANKKLNPIPSESEVTDDKKQEELKDELANRLTNMPKMGSAPPRPSPLG